MLYWLSFVDPKKPAGERAIGVSLVEADSDMEAIRLAWKTGCNPGGEVMALEVNKDRITDPMIWAKISTAPKNMLLTRSALEALGIA